MIAGFVPDNSDGVAAESHRLPWGPHPAGRPDLVDAETVADRMGLVNRRGRTQERWRRSIKRRSRLVGRPAPGGRTAAGRTRAARGGGGGLRSS